MQFKLFFSIQAQRVQAFLLTLIFFFSLVACSEQNQLEQDQAKGRPLAEQSSPPGSRSGKEVYESYCFACHDHGAAGAPVTYQALDWSDRVTKTKQALVTSVEVGVGAMPKNGSCFDCTVEELGLAVDFMLNTIPKAL